MKIRPMAAELFHVEGETGREADRQTDMTKLLDAFSTFTNAPKIADLFP